MNELLVFVIVMIPLIIIHEFGHLLACKSVGITVLEFGLGIPPRAAKLFRWGETDFTLNWLPLGGFVMPYGEDFIKPQTEDELAPIRADIAERGIENPKSVFQAKPWEKLWFLFAGPLANFIGAFVIFVALALTGLLAEEYDVTVISVYDENSALQANDIITHVNDTKIKSIGGFATFLSEDPQPLKLTVQRGDETVAVEINPLESLDVNPPTDLVGIGQVQPDSPAAASGFLAGDQFVSINGEDIDSIQKLVEVTRTNANIPMNVTVLRNGELEELTVTPEFIDGKDSPARIGVSLNFALVQDYGFSLSNYNYRTYSVRLPLIDSIDYGISNFSRAINLIVSIPQKLMRGELSAEEARPVSVIGIAQIGGQIIEERPYQEFVVFAALISIALAITNLLPIPGLDGGRIFFVLIEIVRGKPMTPEREGLVHLIGIGLVLSLSVVLMFHDIINPFQWR